MLSEMRSTRPRAGAMHRARDLRAIAAEYRRSTERSDGFGFPPSGNGLIGERFCIRADQFTESASQPAMIDSFDLDVFMRGDQALTLLVLRCGEQLRRKAKLCS